MLPMNLHTEGKIANKKKQDMQLNCLLEDDEPMEVAGN